MPLQLRVLDLKHLQGQKNQNGEENYCVIRKLNDIDCK